MVEYSQAPEGAQSFRARVDAWRHSPRDNRLTARENRKNIDYALTHAHPDDITQDPHTGMFTVTSHPDIDTLPIERQNAIKILRGFPSSTLRHYQDTIEARAEEDFAAAAEHILLHGAPTDLVQDGDVFTVNPDIDPLTLPADRARVVDLLHGLTDSGREQFGTILRDPLRRQEALSNLYSDDDPVQTDPGF